MIFLLRAAFFRRKSILKIWSPYFIENSDTHQRPPIGQTEGGCFHQKPLFKRSHPAWSSIFEQGSSLGDPKTNINSSSRSNPDEQSMLIKIKINNCFFFNLVQMFPMFQIWPNSPKMWSMQGKTRHASVAWCPQIAFVSKTKTCLIFFCKRK